MPQAAVVMLRVMGALAGLRSRGDRRRAAALGERVFPGRLRVLGSRTLFPQTTGSEVTLGLADDADAVVRLRVEDDVPGEEALRAAVARALADAADWRTLKSAFAEGGYEVHALERLVARPWVSAEVGNGNVAEVTARLAACVRRWEPGERGTDVLVAPPEAVRELPPGRPGWPEPLRLTAAPRLAVLAGRRPYLRFSCDPAAGPALSLERPFPLRESYEAAVSASATRWLAGAFPETEDIEVTRVMGVNRLLPGRVDRTEGHVLFRDEPEEGRIRFGRHALRVVTDLDGELAGEPAVLRDVRDADGTLRLPPLR